MSIRLHASRPAPYFGNQQARPIDRKDSNPARALGLLLGGLCIIAWAAVIYGLIWIASVPA